MLTSVLTEDKDPMGAAIMDFHKTGKAGKLKVLSPDFDDDEIPVSTLFRKFDDMPEIEKKALELASGKILDVGAGAGCHSLVLKGMGKEVEAIDISPLSVEVMLERGIDARTANILDDSFAGEYDTILMLMNGSGIIGNIGNIGHFFLKARHLLRKGGCILMDSSDLKYLYTDEDGSMLIDLNGYYYGEMRYRMQYRKIRGDEFPWLYIDFSTLAHHAALNGFRAELLLEDGHYGYLCRITMV